MLLFEVEWAKTRSKLPRHLVQVASRLHLLLLSSPIVTLALHQHPESRTPQRYFWYLCKYLVPTPGDFLPFTPHMRAHRQCCDGSSSKKVDTGKISPCTLPQAPLLIRHIVHWEGSVGLSHHPNAWPSWTNNEQSDQGQPSPWR
jgi:hypothetical protein